MVELATDEQIETLQRQGGLSASPPTVLALIARLERAEAQVRCLERVLAGKGADQLDDGDLIPLILYAVDRETADEIVDAFQAAKPNCTSRVVQ